MARLDTSLLGFTGYRLQRTTGAAMTKMTPVFAKFGLRRVTFSTLALVVDKPGMRQGQLAEALAIERPNFVKIVDELEQAGLLQRRPVVDDRRAYALHATPKGCALAQQASEAVLAYDQKMLAGLSPAQVTALHHALQLIDANANSLEARDEQ